MEQQRVCRGDAGAGDRIEAYREGRRAQLYRSPGREVQIKDTTAPRERFRPVDFATARLGLVLPDGVETPVPLPQLCDRSQVQSRGILLAREDVSRDTFAALLIGDKVPGSEANFALASRAKKTVFYT
ncbi:hypothetical protein EJB05_01956, partial [Eragrostis curvula]